MVAYELLHAFKRRLKGNKTSFALKLDMSKAYDHVEWHFLSEMISKLGFNARWISPYLLFFLKDFPQLFQNYSTKD